MHKWLRTYFGEYVYQKQQAFVNTHWPGIFGLELGFLGEPIGLPLLKGSRIHHLLYLTENVNLASFNHVEKNISYCIAHGESLPLQNSSVDCMVLYHAIETSAHPHELLREVERVLIPNGHVIIIGFNPISMLGFTLPFYRRHFRHLKHYYHPQRVEDWLKLLGFETLAVESCLFAPALPFKKWFSWMSTFDRIGQFLFPYSGGVYMIRAIKRVLPLTPIPSMIKVRRKKIPQMAPTSSFEQKSTLNEK